MRMITVCGVLSSVVGIGSVVADSSAELPPNLRVVLENTRPLQFERRGRLPLFVLPISNSLQMIDDARSERLLQRK